MRERCWSTSLTALALVTHTFQPATAFRDAAVSWVSTSLRPMQQKGNRGLPSSATATSTLLNLYKKHLPVHLHSWEKMHMCGRTTGTRPPGQRGPAAQFTDALCPDEVSLRCPARTSAWLPGGTGEPITASQLISCTPFSGLAPLLGRRELSQPLVPLHSAP